MGELQIPDMILWPAWIGAILGLPFILWASLWLQKRWKDLSARKRWGIAAFLVLFEAAYWLNVYVWLVEPAKFEIRHITIADERWHGDPVDIALIGDTHVGSPHVNAARMRDIVKRVSDTSPDLVLLLGDYAAGHRPEAELSERQRQEIRDGIDAFSALHPPLGTVAVLGNHDVWYDRDAISEELMQSGAQVLWNQNVRIRRPGGDFVIAGLADADTGAPDFEAALQGAPRDLPVIAMTHNPDLFPERPRSIWLMFAAHTHCGQVWLPFIGRAVVPSRFGERYACGKVEEDGGTLYVTGGIGTSILPVRFFNWPEVTFVRVRAPTEEELAEKAAQEAETSAR